jgi:thioredoxin 1
MARAAFDEIIHSDKPVLIDFSADWCGPCRMLAPVLEQLKQEMGEKLRIVKIDVDKNPAVSARYQIQGVPTLMLFRQGQMLWRQSGLMSLQQLRQAVAQVA